MATPTDHGRQQRLDGRSGGRRRQPVANGRTLPIALTLILAILLALPGEVATVVKPASAQTTTTFTSSSPNSPITINDPLPTPAPANPYPSNISVSGLTGTISKVTVTLTNLTEPRPDDLDLLLVGPTGATF